MAEIPLNPKATLHRDFLNQLDGVNTRLFEDSYKAAGRRSPKWDEPAIAMLELFLQHTSEAMDEASSEKAMLEAGQKAISAGCDDPWILTIFGSRLVYAKRPAEAIKVYQAALAGYGKTPYPARCRALAAVRLVQDSAFN